MPMGPGQPSPIRHVFYIIKENRTYDQVLGDIPRGNGDASLVQFGREVTPNHHALAETYVLLDNYYAPGDQSALGHRWCTQGYASDWIHKYGNARNDANPMLYAPSDFLWDNAKAHQVSVRSYGERGVATITPARPAGAKSTTTGRVARAKLRSPRPRLCSGYATSITAISGLQYQDHRPTSRGQISQGVRGIREERQSTPPDRTAAAAGPHQRHGTRVPDAARLRRG